MNFSAESFRSPEIARATPRTADQQFALGAGAEQLHLSVHHVAGVVGNGRPMVTGPSTVTSSTVATTVASVGP